MTEPRADFELSKLAKEAGFNWEVTSAFDENGKMFHGGYCNHNWYKHYHSVPTLSHLAMWLRVVHGVYCAALPHYDYLPSHWTFDVFLLKDKNWLRKESVGGFSSHDSALSAALTEALKIVIERKKQENEQNT